jgi:sterol desaturase/sphingolipid hydroxylase (fatty acid hydroxylase superfamily)
MQYSVIYLFSIVLILLEIGLMRQHRKIYFSPQESLTTLGIAIGHRLATVLFSGLTLSAYFFVWQFRPFTVPLNHVWSIILLFLGLEFCYYWHHRAAHEVRWLWATHAVHHSAHYLNLSAAYRLGWTGWLSGNFLFFLPLAWLGFHPVAIAVGLFTNLIYQFWIHTELIPKLGWLEWILNTPSHHRVHHASNVEYLDRNYGGVLIVFDRLFGTFASEHTRPIYGLTHPIRSHNPITIVFSEWRRLFQDLNQATDWRDRAAIIFGRPT